MHRIFCQVCPPTFRTKNANERVGVLLDLVETNYSGCGVDHYQCPRCQSMFCISYKVDEVTRIYEDQCGPKDSK